MIIIFDWLLTEYINMLHKEKLAQMLLEGFGAGKMRNVVKREKIGCFQRDKEALVREILSFHEQKTC